MFAVAGATFDGAAAGAEQRAETKPLFRMQKEKDLTKSVKSIIIITKEHR